MFTKKITFIVLMLGMSIAATSYSADERIQYGWGGTGGGNLTMFSKDHTEPATRAGELAFIYGGSAAAEGDITFLYFNGSDWVENMSMDESGTLRVGVSRTTDCGGCKLAINGKITSTEVKIADVTNWPDYVFKENYDLRPLKDIESFIKKNGHLPDMPSAAEVNDQGIELGKMNAGLLRKIEELTLYMIEIKKENKKLHQIVSKLALEEMDEH